MKSLTKIVYESITDVKNEKEAKLKIREIPIDSVKAKNHSHVIIDGIEIYFPYKPYECQITYMRKSTLNNKKSYRNT